MNKVTKIMEAYNELTPYQQAYIINTMTSRWQKDNPRKDLKECAEIAIPKCDPNSVPVYTINTATVDSVKDILAVADAAGSKRVIIDLSDTIPPEHAYGLAETLIRLGYNVSIQKSGNFDNFTVQYRLMFKL